MASLFQTKPNQLSPAQPTPPIPRHQRTISTSPFTWGYKPAATTLFLYHFAGTSGTIWDETLAAYWDLVKHPDFIVRQQWLTSGKNAFGHLFQSYGTTEGMDLFNWIHRAQVPHNKKVPYLHYTVDIRPEKSKIHQTRITAGGNRLDYHGNVSMHTTSMETIKTHWNSVVSTPNARYCTGDISNMYLCLMHDDTEYVRFPVQLILHNFIAHYKLQSLIRNGYVYDTRIKKAGYGLKKSGKISHDDLVAYLKTFGYHKAPRTEGLFLHDTQEISFTLVVDDFGIKYTNKSDVNHLIASVRAK